MKRVAKVFLFTGLFCCLFSYINKIFMVKLLDQPWDNYYKTVGFYEEPKDSMDVIFFGSSVSFCDINPMEIWKEYGIPSYNFANGAQRIQISEYYLKEALQRQKPKVAVLEVSIFSETIDLAEVDTVLIWNLAAMPFSVHKLELIWNYVKPAERLDAIFPITFYHTRWKELNQKDYEIAVEKSGRNVYKGGSTAFSEGGREIWESQANRKVEELDYKKRDGSTISDVTKKHLIRFIQLAKENGCSVVLVKNPQIGDWSQDFSDSIRMVAQENGAEFWDFADPAQIPLDLDQQYMDGSHMNYWGSKEYSKIIGGKLCEEFGLENKQNNKKYQYWHEDCAKYEQLVRGAQEAYRQSQQNQN